MNRLLADPAVAGYESLLGRERVKECATQLLQAVRDANDSAVPAEAQLRDALAERLAREARQGLTPVINATGILLHTNLGRAPLAPQALAALERIAGGYSNLEYDLDSGARGSRNARASSLLTTLTGAQDALVVNNCAAAVLLVLDTFAKNREVIVARNQLVEIGGGFRVPEILERSGARLVEVGTTNKVYARDFERALSPQTAMILRSHASNFRITGFTHDAPVEELAALALRTGIPLVEDLGSGALVDLTEFGLPHERTVQEAVAQGIDLVAFSGDKVLAGPQAGIVVGRASLIARLRANPLLRALRADKMTYAALIETLRLYASPQSRRSIPFFAMLSRTLDELRARAVVYAQAIPNAAIVESTAYAGGGTLPQAGLTSIAVAIDGPRVQIAAERLRTRTLPIVARVQDGCLYVDLRTVPAEADGEVIEALRRAFA